MSETNQTLDARHLNQVRDKARWAWDAGGDARQLKFNSFYQFEIDVRGDIGKILAQDIRRHRLSRDEIAAALTNVSGRTVSKSLIDAWISPTHDHNFPLCLLHAWVIVTGSTRLLEFICAAAGQFLADERRNDLAELAAAELEAERCRKQKRDLKQKLSRAPR